MTAEMGGSAGKKGRDTFSEIGCFSRCTEGRALALQVSQQLRWLISNQ